MVKKISIFGSTGSIGVSSLKVIDSLKGRFRVIALTAQKNVELIIQQINRYSPQYVCLEDENASNKLKQYVKLNKKNVLILAGEDGLETISKLKGIDITIMAMVGFAGLKPLLEVLKNTKRVALANKEVLVSAGELVMKSAKRYKTEIFPIDSEHSAIFQCIRKENSQAIRRIILTASGGPFYNKKDVDFSKVSVEEALNHPNWKMGKKITVDSATLMNKGLEAIEAHHLFGVPMEKIEIIIHPQSIIHSMVEFTDGSILAQLSKPDMALPIRYSLTYPDRLANDNFTINLEKIAKFEFYKPDLKRFPCIGLAFESVKKGFAYPVVLNAANEVAVQKFIDRKITFGDIPKVIGKVLMSVKRKNISSLADIYHYDNWARKNAERITA
ncbi:MAG: 1-deoxy-D-xylulose-5-phosphate reductoisomerase [bacterium]